jgi:ABC-type uncharacterized transport system permease subunit
MPIDPETRELLLRWRSLADGNGLPRANAMIRAFLVLGIISMAVVVFAVVNKLNPAVSGVAVIIPADGIQGFQSIVDTHSGTTWTGRWPDRGQFEA